MYWNAYESEADLGIGGRNQESLFTHVKFEAYYTSKRLRTGNPRGNSRVRKGLWPKISTQEILASRCHLKPLDSMRSSRGHPTEVKKVRIPIRETKITVKHQMVFKNIVILHHDLKMDSENYIY